MCVSNESLRSIAQVEIQSALNDPCKIIYSFLPSSLFSPIYLLDSPSPLHHGFHYYLHAIAVLHKYPQHSAGEDWYWLKCVLHSASLHNIFGKTFCWLCMLISTIWIKPAN